MKSDDVGGVVAVVVVYSCILSMAGVNASAGTGETTNNVINTLVRIQGIRLVRFSACLTF